MSFGDELEAFERLRRGDAEQLRLPGRHLRHARGRAPRRSRSAAACARSGHELVGIRLDSGDLAWLSSEARRILDEAGFPRRAILASNDLDEHADRELKQQGAAIDVWGVGTRLVTAFDQPALGGVYKLSAIREPGGEWEDRVKVSEQTVKIDQARHPAGPPLPRADGELIGDLIWDERHELGRGADDGRSARPDAPEDDPGGRRRRRISWCRCSGGGSRVYDPPGLEEIRARVREQLGGFHEGVKRFVNPHRYPVGMELGYFERKTKLVLAARGSSRQK